MHHLQTSYSLLSLTMSSPAIQTEQPVVATKASRQPTLPDKYGKFIQFAYYMMENVLGSDFQMDKDAYLEKIRLFGTVGEQQVLVQGFFDKAKEVKGVIKKRLSDRKKELAKANKPPRQSRSKAKPTADGETAAPKRSRKKSEKQVVNTQDELLNDLVQLARAETLTIAAVAQPEPVTELPPNTPTKAKVAAVKTPKAPKKAAKSSTQETSE